MIVSAGPGRAGPGWAGLAGLGWLGGELDGYVDSKDPDGPAPIFARAGWPAFAASLKGWC